MANFIIRLITSLTPKAILPLLVLCSVSATSQQDTEFWFAAPDISSSQNDNPIYLRFTSYSAASTITISQPANVGFTPIVVPLAANSYASVDLSPFLASIESSGANIIDDTGLKICY